MELTFVFSTKADIGEGTIFCDIAIKVVEIKAIKTKYLSISQSTSKISI